MVCIHSVCIRKEDRRKGLASRLLRAYLTYVQTSTPHVRELRLICKEDLVSLYQRAGFTLEGASDVVHGQDPWWEMKHRLE